VADGIEFCAKRIIVPLGEEDEVQQRIRHAAHRRYDDAYPGFWPLQHQAGDPAETLRVCQAAASELVYLPAGFAHDDCPVPA
jgi:hypothetical protein